jgi:protein-tyrosine phosphatase
MTFTMLFVGAGNIGRSVLAAAQTERELHRVWPRSADEVVTRSAGVDAIEGLPVAGNLETVAERRDFDLRDHRAVPLTREHADAADLVLTMTRKQRAQLVLQFPHLRTRTFTLLEFIALLENATQARRRAPIGRGDRLETKLRLVVTTAAARHRAMSGQTDEQQWDLFDPYAYSLDIYETVAATIESAVHSLVSDVAVLTGARGSHKASQTA